MRSWLIFNDPLQSLLFNPLIGNWKALSLRKCRHYIGEAIREVVPNRIESLMIASLCVSIKLWKLRRLSVLATQQVKWLVFSELVIGSHCNSINIRIQTGILGVGLNVIINIFLKIFVCSDYTMNLTKPNSDIFLFLHYSFCLLFLFLPQKVERERGRESKITDTKDICPG